MKKSVIAGALLSTVATFGAAGCAGRETGANVPYEDTTIGSCVGDNTNVAPTYLPLEAGYSATTDPYSLLEIQKTDTRFNEASSIGIGTLVCEVALRERGLLEFGQPEKQQYLTQTAIQIARAIQTE